MEIRYKEVIPGQSGANIGTAANPREVCTFPTNQPLYQGAEEAGKKSGQKSWSSRLREQLRERKVVSSSLGNSEVFSGRKSKEDFPNFFISRDNDCYQCAYSDASV